MIEDKIKWITLKNLATSKGLGLQCADDYPDKYLIRLVDGSLCYYTIIFKEDPKSVDQIDFETNYLPTINKPQNAQMSPFASKILSNGKKLYKREHGVQASVGIGETEIFFPIPYPWVKMTGVEVIWGTKPDKMDLLILDTTTGTYTGIPNKVLNQFGYSVNVAEDYFEEQNSYDADLYSGMQIKIVYTSSVIKTVGLNFNLNEVK